VPKSRSQTTVCVCVCACDGKGRARGRPGKRRNGGGRKVRRDQDRGSLDCRSCSNRATAFHSIITPNIRFSIIPPAAATRRFSYIYILSFVIFFFFSFVPRSFSARLSARPPPRPAASSAVRFPTVTVLQCVHIVRARAALVVVPGPLFRIILFCSIIYGGVSVFRSAGRPPCGGRKKKRHVRITYCMGYSDVRGFVAVENSILSTPCKSDDFQTFSNYSETVRCDIASQFNLQSVI